MAKIGRNAPCPCGSGKKYKQCCLRKGSEQESGNQSEAKAAGVALDWLDQRYGEAMLDAFKGELLGVLDEEEFAALGDMPEDLLTMIDINIRERLLTEGSLELPGGPARCMDLVLGFGGLLLDARQRTYLEKMGKASLSLYEIVECVPDEGFYVQDLVDESEPVQWVVDRQASRGAKEGSVIGFRLIPGPPFRLSGSLYPFPEPRVPPLIEELRIELDAADDAELARALRGEIITAHWLRFLTAPPPEIVDASSGEPLALVTDHYKIEDLEKLDAALSASPEVEGNREMDWNRIEGEGDTLRPLQSLSLGRPGQLEVFSRTLSMADDGRAWLEEIAGSSISWITREITDPASLWDQRHDGPPEAGPPSFGPDPSELPAGTFQTVYEKIYADWADQPMPALGNSTPRQAIETPEGRRSVIEVIRSYERQEKKESQSMGREAVSFDFLWKELEIERPADDQP